MANNWTDEQRQAIENRDRNLLVSAAAGSGKTAVLTARILSMIADGQHPTDIDRLLVVTFTRAAAGEMRDRIREAIRDRAAAEPENTHLRRQLSLLGRAQITTIDSFLSYVVRSNYSLIDIDPAFRVADEGEIRLLQSDVLGKLLEERYAAEDPAFIQLSESLSTGKTDAKLEELVLRLFRTTESMVDPDAWLRMAEDCYRVENEDDLNSTEWCRWYLSYVRTFLQDAVEQMNRLIEKCNDQLPALVPHFQNDREQIRKSVEFSDYTEMTECLNSVQFGMIRASSVGTKSSEEPFASLKKERDAIKGKIGALAKSMVTTSELIRIITAVRPSVEALTALTEEFSLRFREEKKRRMIADFSDISRMALRILRGENGEPTDIARQFAAHFDEVMIDEYQDSNEIQEAILTAVSREIDGRPNIFMVGDVKQSIYRFRMARPELFTEKYRTYTTEDSPHQKVELHMNFRSRRSVLECVNWFFYRIMRAEVGGVEYNEDCALNPCDTLFPEYEPEEGSRRSAFTEKAEFLLLDLDTEEDEAEDTGGDDQDGDSPEDAENQEKTVEFDYTSVEWEARMVAGEIRKIMDPSEGKVVYDKALKRYRPLRFGDIAVLLRASAGWAEAFLETLNAEGIPASTEGSRGYYESREVRLVMNLLTVIDNPESDIPLASVLHSPMFNVTSDELAEIRNGYEPYTEGLGFYGAMLNYLKTGENEVLLAKLRRFSDMLQHFRELSHQLPLSELLRRICRETGLIYTAAAMPGGIRRKANLEMLVTKAGDFEKTSYRGVFRFIRYIEKLNSYEMDEGEAAASGENENQVQILTIHKSKGLEYPVVFLSGLGKGFNKMDERADVIVHQNFGIGVNLVDLAARTKTQNPMKAIFAARLAEENRGEELRVLYVAMTRAREKLYLTGSVKNRKEMEKIAKLLEENRFREPEVLSYTEIRSAKSMADWLLQSLREETPVDYRIRNVHELAAELLQNTPEESGEHQTLRDLLSHAEPSAEDSRRLREVMTGDYHYDDLYRIDTSVSVSRLKMEHIQESLTEAAPEPHALYNDDTIPQEDGGRIRGAARGTLYHSIFEWADPHEDIEAQLDRWEKEHLISEKEKDTINPNIIREFYASPVGKRFTEAYDRGCACREKQFIIGVPVSEIRKDTELREDAAGELMMIQGVIDLYFEEDDGIILVDYKTDRVRDPERLSEMYREQLKLYKRALGMFTHLPVREMWIYSTTLGKAVRVED